MSGYSQGSGPEGLAVLTVATKPTAYFGVLLQSCRRHGIEPVVLGMGAPWRWFATKLNLIYHHLTQGSPLPYTLYVDGFDSIFQSGLTEIWKAYREFQSPLVIGADVGCWPDTSIEGRFPASPTRYRFVNAGGFLGETTVLIRALEWMGCPFADEHQHDQDKLSYYFLDHPHEARLDYHSRIFQTLNWAEDAVEFRAVAFFTRGSGKKPAILHLNGNVSENLSYARKLGYTI